VELSITLGSPRHPETAATGALLKPPPALLTLTGLTIAAGDVVTLNMEPQNLRRFYINNGADRERVTNVLQWGTVAWTSMENAFYGCSNLQVAASDIPDFSNLTSLLSMFRSCSSLTGPANINSWDIQTVTNLAAMFQGASAFNQALNNWNTQNVMSTLNLFNGAIAFNQNIESWNMTNAVSIAAMFQGATSFNQPLNNWNTQNILNMAGLFSGATAFNQPLDNWNVSGVQFMSTMFQNADAFNQNINNWNVGSVTTMGSMFLGTDIFNQPLDSWNTQNVTNMNGMFSGATAFNQSLGSWTLNPAVTMTTMLNVNGMDCENYSKTLIGWSNNPATPNGRTLGAFNREYGLEAVAARNNLISKGWTFSSDIATGSYCSDDFITEWTFPSAATQIRFNAQTDGGAVNYTWTATPSGNSGSGSFTQAGPGLVTLSGLNIAAGDVVTLSMEPQNLRRFYIGFGPNRVLLTDVKQWGSVAWSSMEVAFAGCSNLVITATDIPNLSNVNDMSRMFAGCTILNGPSNIGSWNTASVTNMRSMFAEASAFNQNIGSWNTSAVTTMVYMFDGATSFNENIGAWNTGAATDMSFMFQIASSFNQDIGNWNTGAVTNMAGMFTDATAFNQNIGNWNTGAVTDMETMFYLATSFNQDIGAWDTENVTSMSFMFGEASAFNQNIGSWTLNANVNMTNMLNGSGMDCEKLL
jgi:surface protein